MMEIQSAQDKEEREYFSLIERVGSWHKYQFHLAIILSAISMLQAMSMFVAPYLFYSASYQCGDTVSESCTNFVCSLPIEQRPPFKSQSPFHSLADEFGVDFNCEYSSTLTLFSTLIFIGSFSGVLLLSLFTQRFGRKNSLVLSSILFFLGLTLTLFGGLVKSIPLVICSILLIFWGSENSYQYIYCFASEVIAQKKRVLYINLLNITYGFGIMLNAIFFYNIRQWKIIFTFFFCLPSVLVIISVIFFVKKTPIDLLKSENEEEILQTLRIIAEKNKVPYSITQEQVRVLKQRYSLASKGYHFTLIDIFRHQSLRSILFPLAGLSFLTNYLFSSPAVIKSDDQSSLFEQGIVQGLSYLVGVPAVYLALNNLKRRFSMFVSLGVMAIFAILLRIQSESKTSLAYLSCYFIYRFLCCGCYGVFYIISYQIFPTQVRAVGSNFVYIVGSLAGIVQPSIVAALQRREINVLNQFIVVSLLGLIPTYFIRETFKVPPPQIIEELNNKAE